MLPLQSSKNVNDFNAHKKSQKLNVLKRVSQYMDLNKCKNVTKTFIRSKYDCYLMIWMHDNRYDKNISTLLEFSERFD